MGILRFFFYIDGFCKMKSGLFFGLSVLLEGMMVIVIICRGAFYKIDSDHRPLSKDNELILL